jgi:hypothetical protein
MENTIPMVGLLTPFGTRYVMELLLKDVESGKQSFVIVQTPLASVAYANTLREIKSDLRLDVISPQSQTWDTESEIVIATTDFFLDFMLESLSQRRSKYPARIELGDVLYVEIFQTILCELKTYVSLRLLEIVWEQGGQIPNTLIHFHNMAVWPPLKSTLTIYNTYDESHPTSWSLTNSTPPPTDLYQDMARKILRLHMDAPGSTIVAITSGLVEAQSVWRLIKDITVFRFHLQLVSESGVTKLLITQEKNVTKVYIVPEELEDLILIPVDVVLDSYRMKCQRRTEAGINMVSTRLSNRNTSLARCSLVASADNNAHAKNQLGARSGDELDARNGGNGSINGGSGSISERSGSISGGSGSINGRSGVVSGDNFQAGSCYIFSSLEDFRLPPYRFQTPLLAISTFLLQLGKTMVDDEDVFDPAVDKVNLQVWGGLDVESRTTALGNFMLQVPLSPGEAAVLWKVMGDTSPEYLYATVVVTSMITGMDNENPYFVYPPPLEGEGVDYIYRKQKYKREMWTVFAGRDDIETFLNIWRALSIEVGSQPEYNDLMTWASKHGLNGPQLYRVGGRIKDVQAILEQQGVIVAPSLIDSASASEYLRPIYTQVYVLHEFVRAEPSWAGGGLYKNTSNQQVYTIDYDQSINTTSLTNPERVIGPITQEIQNHHGTFLSISTIVLASFK